jgi:chromosome segregation protein
LEDLKTKQDAINAKVEQRTAELTKAQENQASVQAKLDDLNQQVEDIKGGKDLWEEIKQTQADLDAQNALLEQVINDMKELQGVERILDDIEKKDAEIAEIQAEIEDTKNKIAETEASAEKMRDERASAQEEVEKLKAEREEFANRIKDIYTQIDAKQVELNAATDKMRGLENIQRIITTIANIESEIAEAKTTIEENAAKETEVTQEIEDLNAQIAEKDAQVDQLQQARDGFFAQQKEAQDKLAQLNTDSQTKNKEMTDWEAVQKRAQEILDVSNEIQVTTDNIATFEEEMGSLVEEIENLSQDINKIQDQLAGLSKNRQAIFQKMKEFQEQHAALNTEMSAEQNKLSNFQSRKGVVTEKIEEFLGVAKEYGALPEVTEDLDEATLQATIQQASEGKKKLEPVNLKAIEQFEEVKERFDEIDMRRQALQRERKAILDSIERIELEKTRTFMKAYHEINRHFASIFQKLSPGGSAKMLLERPDKPFEGGVAIEARPRGKKISSLEILSGGEKTLVALSFIFAVQNFMPSPFYVMDEIDAALDGPNVHRVSMLIREFASNSQFLVISHREENIVNADRIYGISMQDGITDIFSVNLEEEAKRIDEEEPEDEVAGK